MQYFTGFDLSNCGLSLAEEGPVEFDFVLRDMDDHQPETESLEILLVLKSTVNSQQNVEPILQQQYQMVVFEPVLTQIYCRLNSVPGKAFDDSGIDTGIH